MTQILDLEKPLAEYITQKTKIKFKLLPIDTDYSKQIIAIIPEHNPINIFITCSSTHIALKFSEPSSSAIIDITKPNSLEELTQRIIHYTIEADLNKFQKIKQTISQYGMSYDTIEYKIRDPEIDINLLYGDYPITPNDRIITSYIIRTQNGKTPAVELLPHCYHHTYRYYSPQQIIKILQITHPKTIKLKKMKY